MDLESIGPFGGIRQRCAAAFAIAALTGFFLTGGVATAANTCNQSNYQHAWVTVSDVEAHMGKSGWVDLTPGLQTAKQVDLLDATSTDCLLASLGVTSGLPAGSYQQIRIILWNNVGPGKGKGKGKGNGGAPVTPPASNACSSINTYDCVELADTSLHPLNVNVETRTGLRIPPGQIAQGGLKVTNGQVVDLDIDFDACRSIVVAGRSGQYLLKPTLNRGEADISPLLNGTVVVGTSSNGTVSPANPSSPVAGANVYLESQTPADNVTIYPGLTSTTPVENLIDTTVTGADGSFAFCAPTAGTYEIVADSDSMPSKNASNATITTGVTPTGTGANIGAIPLLDDGSSPALLESTFTTQNSTALGDLVTFGGTQPFNSGANNAIIPPLAGTLPAPASGAPLPVVATGASPNTSDCKDINPAPTCPGSGTNCGCFTIALPNSNPVIGAVGGPYAAPAGNPASYSVVGSASNLDGSGTPECNPSALITDPASPIALTANPLVVTTALLGFAGCD